MFRSRWILVLALTAPACAFDHALLDDILKSTVADGRVHYGKLRGREADLDRYLTALAAAKPDGLGSAHERTAFWINAYNAFTLKNVLDAFPISSPKSVPGFFDETRRTIASQALTLNDIENERLRKELPDPRVHFALVCAATGCPGLRPAAWTAATLDGDLEAATKAFLADRTKGARVEGDTLHLSQIFRWYAKDFDKAGGVAAFVGKHGLKAAKTADLDYDWTLNAQELSGAKRIPLLQPPGEP